MIRQCWSTCFQPPHCLVLSVDVIVAVMYRMDVDWICESVRVKYLVEIYQCIKASDVPQTAYDLL